MSKPQLLDINQLMSQLSSLPPEESKEAARALQDLALEQIVASGIQTEEDLHAFVFSLLGIDLPSHSVCHNHDTPWDYVVHEVLGPGGVTLVEACRNGFKTLSTSVIDLAQAAGLRAAVLHMGAVDEQAKNGKKYVDELTNSSFLSDLVKKQTLEFTQFDNGGFIKVAPCTVNQANSPRNPKVKIDEMDLADPVALKETKGIPSSDRHGNVTSWTGISTIKYANGNMQRELQNAPRSNAKVLRWCYKEVTQTCPDSRSGTTPVSVYVDLNELIWISEEEYTKRRKYEELVSATNMKVSSSSHFEKFKVFDGCLKCPLLATCRGDLKRAQGILPIEDLIREFGNWSVDDWITQKECRGVPSTGRIFRAFSRDRNVCEFPVNQKEDDRLWRSPRTGQILGQVRMGKDYGYEHPDVTIVGQILMGRCGHKHLWIADECYLTHKTDEEVIKHLVGARWFAMDGDGRVKDWKPQDHVYYGRPSAFCADPSDRKGSQIYRKHGFPVLRKTSLVEEGLREIRKLIHPIDCEETHLHIHPRCKRLIQDMELYSVKLDATGEATEKPAKGGETAPDHGPDALRMMVVMSFLKTANWTKNLVAGGV